MSDRLTALSLVLEELDVDPNIDTVDQRLAIQKAIYLAQLRVRLGYTYGWYLKGPYSPKLTQDYYELAERIDRGDVEEGTLKPSAQEALAQVKALIDSKPANVSKSDWLELLASLHYLTKKSGFGREQARHKIRETKPHLTGLFDDGLIALEA